MPGLEKEFQEERNTWVRITKQSRRGAMGLKGQNSCSVKVPEEERPRRYFKWTPKIR